MDTKKTQLIIDLSTDLNASIENNIENIESIKKYKISEYKKSVLLKKEVDSVFEKAKLVSGYYNNLMKEALEAIKVFNQVENE